MSEEMEAEEDEGEEGEEEDEGEEREGEEMVLFSFQRAANGQRKGKTKQNKKSESTESQEGSGMEGCVVSPLSLHVVCSGLSEKCGLGLWALGVDSVFLPLMGRGSLH